MATRSSTSRNTDWRQRYLSALDEQERAEQQHRELVELLTRAVVRLVLAAEGQDSRVDGQAARLRELLRKGDSTLRELADAVDVLEMQVKRLDDSRAERLKTVGRACRQLAAQLQPLAGDAALRGELRAFERALKKRSANPQEWPELLAELAALQQRALAGEAPAPGLWQRLFKRRGSEDRPAIQGPAVDSDAAPGPADLAEPAATVHQEVPPDSAGEEPSFARISRPICRTLDEMLRQIEPPAAARDNYQRARDQVARGLNWYELVPTLEDVCLVVISAFDRDQREFQAFLQRLNERLQQADDAVRHSRVAEQQRQVAGRELNAEVQASVSGLRRQVAEATDLKQLQFEVSDRLDAIVGALDSFQRSEVEREQSLAEQLDALVNRVKSMEEQSRDAEQRLEEQRKLALRDVLTQLPNREAYQLRLEEEFERWRRYGRPLVLAVCDVDHFKRINDSYGHLAGDKVLRVIAKTLRQRLRKTDFVGRYGGEEFVLLLPETDASQALQALEGVREAIANCPFHFREQPVAVTVSFGIAEFNEDDKAESVFARADSALYVAKEAGRNRCELASTAV